MGLRTSRLHPLFGVEIHDRDRVEPEQRDQRVTFAERGDPIGEASVEDLERVGVEHFARAAA